MGVAPRVVPVSHAHCQWIHASLSAPDLWPSASPTSVRCRNSRGSPACSLWTEKTSGRWLTAPDVVDSRQNEAEKRQDDGNTRRSVSIRSLFLMSLWKLTRSLHCTWEFSNDTSKDYIQYYKLSAMIKETKCTHFVFLSVTYVVLFFFFSCRV